MGCFGEVLADIMRRRYIAHIDLARALGVSPLLVGRWVRHEAVPSAEDVAALLRVLHRCGPEDLNRLQLAVEALLADQYAADLASPASVRFATLSEKCWSGCPRPFARPLQTLSRAPER